MSEFSTYHHTLKRQKHESTEALKAIRVRTDSLFYEQNQIVVPPGIEKLGAKLRFRNVINKHLLQFYSSLVLCQRINLGILSRGCLKVTGMLSQFLKFKKMSINVTSKILQVVLNHVTKKEGNLKKLELSLDSLFSAQYHVNGVAYYSCDVCDNTEKDEFSFKFWIEPQDDLTFEVKLLSP